MRPSESSNMSSNLLPQTLYQAAWTVVCTRTRPLTALSHLSPPPPDTQILPPTGVCLEHKRLDARPSRATDRDRPCGVGLAVNVLYARNCLLMRPNCVLSRPDGRGRPAPPSSAHSAPPSNGQLEMMGGRGNKVREGGARVRSKIPPYVSCHRRRRAVAIAL